MPETAPRSSGRGRPPRRGGGALGAPATPWHPVHIEILFLAASASPLGAASWAPAGTAAASPNMSAKQVLIIDGLVVRGASMREIARFYRSAPSRSKPPATARDAARATGSPRAPEYNRMGIQPRDLACASKAQPRTSRPTTSTSQ